MTQHRQHRELVAARRAATGWHDGGGIPAKHRGTLANGGDEREAGGQALVGGRDGHERNAFRVQTANIATKARARPYHVIT